MRHQWVGGQWLKSNRDRIPVVNPATEEVIDHIPRGTAADADRTVQAAREAFNTWRWMPAVERAQRLPATAGDLRSRHKELATVRTEEGGNPSVKIGMRSNG